MPSLGVPSLADLKPLQLARDTHLIKSNSRRIMLSKHQPLTLIFSLSIWMTSVFGAAWTRDVRHLSTVIILLALTFTPSGRCARSLSDALISEADLVLFYS
jgi:hypothetical protein